MTDILMEIRALAPPLALNALSLGWGPPQAAAPPAAPAAPRAQVAAGRGLTSEELLAAHEAETWSPPRPAALAVGPLTGPELLADYRAEAYRAETAVPGD